MRGPAVVGVVLLGVAVQAVLARYTVGGSWVFDLVLVSVVGAGLQWGPVAGLFAGTIGGLLQDVLSGDVVGVGGLVKTLVGFAAGLVGAQFVMTQASGRALVVALATPIHRMAMMAIMAMIDQHWPGISWGAMLAEVGINTLVAFAVFQGMASLPGAMARQRSNRRASLGRRRW
jgi:rod shape-determining protein MreD